MLIQFAVPTLAEEVFETSRVGSIVTPNTDVLEGESETVVLMEMPGVEKASVKVTFERSILTVSAERKLLEVPDRGRVLLHEQVVTGYRRSLRIHHPVEAGSMTAQLENGLLRVILPKAEIAKPRVIEVR